MKGGSGGSKRFPAARPCVKRLLARDPDGRVSLDGESLRSGDAAKVTGEVELALATDVAAELIRIDARLEFESIGVWGARLRVAWPSRGESGERWGTSRLLPGAGAAQ